MSSHSDEDSEKAEDVQNQDYALNKRELPGQYGVENYRKGSHGND